MALYRNYKSGKSADGNPMKRLSVAELIRRLQAMPQHLPVVFDPDPAGHDAGPMGESGKCLEVGTRTLHEE